MTTTSTRPRTERPRPKRRGRGWLRVTLGVSLALLGVVMFAGQMFAPQTSERIVGEVRVKVAQIQQRAAGHDLPVVELSGPGTIADLDACDGTFVEMPSYELDGLQPIFAAHNNCRGEVILPLQVGDQLEVAGRGTWEVTEIRDLSKTWSTARELVGMRGRFILQTCYWGQPTMKFMAIRPVRA